MFAGWRMLCSFMRDRHAVMIINVIRILGVLIRMPLIIVWHVSVLLLQARNVVLILIRVAKLVLIAKLNSCLFYCSLHKDSIFHKHSRFLKSCITKVLIKVLGLRTSYWNISACLQIIINKSSAPSLSVLIEKRTWTIMCSNFMRPLRILLRASSIHFP